MCHGRHGVRVLGHVHELAAGANLDADLWFDRLPLLPGAAAHVEAGVVPGATGRNLAFYGKNVAWSDELPPLAKPLLADPQTSGGLILAVPDALLSVVVADLESRGALAQAVIGRLTARGEGPRLRVGLAGRA